jgi:acylphosphatase
MNKRLHLIIHGDVQGVFFRVFVQETAQKLSLVGWVRNTPDGAIEVVAEGTREALQALLDRCTRGPPGAIVDRIEQHLDKATDEFTRFEIKL